MTLLIRPRPAADAVGFPDSLHPVLRRLYAARGVEAAQLSLELKHLLPPAGLRGIEPAAALLADAIEAGEGIVIAGDYDADGATGTALGVLGLRALGAAEVHYVVPDRFRMGYGLSPELAELAAATGAGVLVTVDNGIASLAGVRHAQELGLSVVVTDHHLPGPELPGADAIVNPNQPGCGFASKALAGVGVMFYLLLALRAELRRRGAFEGQPEPNLSEWLDLVALGTVADLARLDYNNRILVENGLRRIRAGRARPGLLALLKLAGREPSRVGSVDLGFALGPRINAAGRLDDIRTGIDCLLADSEEAAQGLAAQLDRFNRERRELQAQMSEEALLLSEDSEAVGVVVFEEDWHEGIVGLVASKLKERLHRPSIAFARAQEPGLLKGSARSIDGLHVRDALAAIDARQPGLIGRFGGHAMAAGLSLPEAHLAAFGQAFDAICREWLSQAQLQRVLETDGELLAEELQLATALQLEHAGPWGQGFPEPMFEGRFEVLDARLIGSDGQHAKYRLRSAAGGAPLTAVDFHGGARLQSPRSRLQAVFTLAVNRWQGAESLDLRIEHLQPL
ncbi:single-stranded-DNA-specific exonuclease RecJ [Solimonas fluminis]|uniref:Single-stranded-DNA-specific exonuclease RecJ n=1 Tax=Solimonas fluminis TaxID=2086571 RepID=A0A2S5TBM2_9GAMM|nr:single-stranded-DNA-specific exonuclease RecJ [Solimonas fluminis]PPE72247.1 single-stranded-DNA-specific exonuclease RecJ [Solimonas fluminis]